MTDNPSDRLLSQRYRNRMMEELFCLADWEDTLSLLGIDEYLQILFDWVPDYPTFPPNEVITEKEKIALSKTLDLLNEAISDKSARADMDSFIRSGWPQRIASTAQTALFLFESRGRFSEKLEEIEPSGHEYS
ncbi:hypothetical protein E4V01_21765 [Methylorubrum sp. Q1]|uniref:hypothetical protein n=1 Tax=Methylorubrum sp. Q1 TaxID=2562453 RepID=UPI001075D3A6|nr:hypothetical protein [Methylorubrum sp. Q1]TFZ55680.1 hypothetical protein E4V01_21765 [Methylorubrum sp. Q1]